MHILHLSFNESVFIKPSFPPSHICRGWGPISSWCTAKIRNALSVCYSSNSRTLNQQIISCGKDSNTHSTLFEYHRHCHSTKQSYTFSTVLTCLTFLAFPTFLTLLHFLLYYISYISYIKCAFQIFTLVWSNFRSGFLALIFFPSSICPHFKKFGKCASQELKRWQKIKELFFRLNFKSASSDVWQKIFFWFEPFWGDNNFLYNF